MSQEIQREEGTDRQTDRGQTDIETQLQGRRRTERQEGEIGTEEEEDDEEDGDDVGDDDEQNKKKEKEILPKLEREEEKKMYRRQYLLVACALLLQVCLGLCRALEQAEHKQSALVRQTASFWGGDSTSSEGI